MNNKREPKSKYSKKDKAARNNKNNYRKKDQNKDLDRCAGDVQEYTNDVTWYSKNAQLLYDAANLPYNNPTGAPITFQYSHPNITNNRRYYLPGITTLWWRPTPGISDDNNSPINMAARNLYSFIRQANSGAKNYDSPDLMIYLLAMDSLYAFHAWMMRVYGTLNFTMPTNRYLPKHLVEAQGADYDDLIGTMADFRYYINSFAVRLGALAVPNDMYYFTRHRWMSSNVYMDEPSVKPQLYMYVPEGFFKYQLSSNSSGMLKFTPLSPTGAGFPTLTLAKIKSYGEELLNAVLGDEDINIMSGDILKAYGGNLVTIPTVDENYAIMPVYSAEVLSQIHNATDIPSALASDGIWDIGQDPTGPSLVFNPKVQTTSDFTSGALATYYPKYAIIDMNIDMPTAADTMVATRCTTMINAEVTPAPDAISADQVTISLAAAGSEVITMIINAEMHDDDFSGDVEFARTLERWKSFDFFDLTESKDAQDNPCMIVSANRNYDLIRKLDFGACNSMPLSINLVKSQVSRASESKIVYQTYILGQKNNFTTVDSSVLKRMHECALLSEFNVPAMGLRK